VCAILKAGGGGRSLAVTCQGVEHRRRRGGAGAGTLWLCGLAPPAVGGLPHPPTSSFTEGAPAPTRAGVGVLKDPAQGPVDCFDARKRC
jgi:hypothetical protein